MKLVRVKLSEVPFERRMQGARTLLREARTQEERNEIIAAAFFPSDKTYYLRAAA